MDAAVAAGHGRRLPNPHPPDAAGKRPKDLYVLTEPPASRVGSLSGSPKVHGGSPKGGSPGHKAEDANAALLARRHHVYQLPEDVRHGPGDLIIDRFRFEHTMMKGDAKRDKPPTAKTAVAKIWRKIQDQRIPHIVLDASAVGLTPESIVRAIKTRVKDRQIKKLQQVLIVTKNPTTGDKVVTYYNHAEPWEDRMPDSAFITYEDRTAHPKLQRAIESLPGVEMEPDDEYPETPYRFFKVRPGSELQIKVWDESDEGFEDYGLSRATHISLIVWDGLIADSDEVILAVLSHVLKSVPGDMIFGWHNEGVWLRRDRGVVYVGETWTQPDHTFDEPDRAALGIDVRIVDDDMFCVGVLE